MRRILAICLLIMMPLQFSWAAVASYCGHETGVRAQHVGHHAHEHHTDASAPAASDGVAGNTNGAVDADCIQCHGCGPAMLGAVDVLPLDTRAARPRSVALAATAVLALTRPERPQWAPLA